MKIWTITTDDHNGHECRTYYTEAEADAAALEACRKDWPKDEGPCPGNWREAMEVIEQGDGLLMWVEEHDISGHPAMRLIQDMAKLEADSDGDLILFADENRKNDWIDRITALQQMEA